MATLDSPEVSPIRRTSSNRIGREIGSTSSRSFTHADSALSSSFGSTGSHSSSSSRKHARPQQPVQQQQQQPQSNESTPIFNAADTSRRYQSTMGTADTQSGPIGGPKASNNGGPSVNSNLPNSNQQDGQPTSPSEPHRPWYSRVADRYGSLELDNKGSVARDHLALERTFLAWMRTSLAFASIGIAVTQLFRLNSTNPTTTHGGAGSSSAPPAVLPSLHSPSFYDVASLTPPSPNSTNLRSVGKPLGTTFIAVAILILVVGFHRYFEAQYWIVRGKFPASRGSVALTGFVAAALIISALVVILAVSPSANG